VTEKQQLHDLVDQLPESETVAAARYLQFLIAHEEAPVDPGMLSRIDAARAEPKFPPTLAAGSRVWTEHGFQGLGPREGPKVDIAANQGGTIAHTEKPDHTRDQLLYVVRWDNGQVSKHYDKDLFCIGHFQCRAEFEAAIKPTGDVRLTVGPAGGFRNAEFELEYDGHAQTAEVDDRWLWFECIEPIVKKLGLKISPNRLPKRG
jgi:hypothetical protein